ncbi:MAG: hypothetical protein GX974_10235 [Clostridiales bacterium]|nr:hypothetical protein [Clostridiales bacterium]
MRVIVMGKELDFNNNLEGIKSIFKEIDKIILDTDSIFSHLDIDGVEVYEDHYEYFLQNIEDINVVKVIIKTPNEIAKDTLLSTIQYLGAALPEIEKLSNEFYKTPEPESWAKLADLFEGVKWILDTFSTLDQNYKIQEIVDSYEDWNEYAQYIYSLKELLNEFEGVMENQDYISIADILSYELIPLFDDMIHKLNILVSEETTTSVIN